MKLLEQYLDSVSSFGHYSHDGDPPYSDPFNRFVGTSYSFDVLQSDFMSWPEGARKVVIANRMSDISWSYTRPENNYIKVHLMERDMAELTAIMEAHLEDGYCYLGRS